jgi:hypothetical protein
MARFEMDPQAAVTGLARAGAIEASSLDGEGVVIASFPVDNYLAPFSAAASRVLGAHIAEVAAAVTKGCLPARAASRRWMRQKAETLAVDDIAGRRMRR